MPRHVREERARRLIAVGKALERAALEGRIGRTEDVLIEEIDALGRGTGYTGGYMRVHVPGASACGAQGPSGTSPTHFLPSHSITAFLGL